MIGFEFNGVKCKDIKLRIKRLLLQYNSTLMENKISNFVFGLKFTIVSIITIRCKINGNISCETK